MNAKQVRTTIVTLLAALPESELPKWTNDHDCIWFKNLSMGWNSASAPKQLAERPVEILFAAEAASRELVRRAGGEKS